MGARVQRELAFLLTGKDVSASRAMRGVNRELSGMGKHARKAGRNIGRNLERGILLGGAAAVGATGFAVHAAMDWESAFAGVRKTIEGDVTAIGVGIREMATEMPTAATELAAIAEAAGALGVAKDDVLGFTKTVALLDETTDLTSEAAAMTIGHLKTTLKLAGNDFVELGDALVHLGNNGASTESEIVNMAENIAGAAGTLNLSKEQVLGWSAAVANTGEQAEAGGSSIQRFMLGAFKIATLGGKKLTLMAKTAGMSAKEFKKAFAKDASGTLEQFIVKLGKLEKAEQMAVLAGLGFKDIRITRALLKLLANTDNLTDSLRLAEEGAGAMGREAQRRFETTAAQVDILKNNVNEAAIVIGTELLPVINELANEGVDWLQDNEGEIAAFAKDFAEHIRDAVGWAKSLDWDAIGAALTAGASGAKAIVDAFMGLPPEAKALLLGAYGANKLTGGVVVDIGGQMFNQFLARGSSPANPMWVTSVGGAVGGASGGAGGAGAKGWAARLRPFLRLAAGITGLSMLAGSNSGEQGIPGALGNMAGGAMLGWSMGGPIGAFGGALGGGVKSVQESVSAQSSAHAASVGKTLDVYLRQNPTTSQLQTSLDAVNQGIHDIESNPLLTLVQGDALEQLRAMRADLEAQIATGGRSTLELISAAKRTKDDTVAEERRTRGQILRNARDANRHHSTSLAVSKKNAYDQKLVTSAQSRAIGEAKQAQVAAVSKAEAAARAAGLITAAAMRDAASSINATIRANKPVVQATTVIRTTTVNNRYGSQLPSRVL